MCVWYAENYIYFASCIIFISSIMIIYSLYDTKKNLNNIKKRAHYECPVKVMREGKSGPLREISSVDLVPGDVIEIPDQVQVPCDIILLQGTCVLNESMLTGESVPAIKNSIPFTTDVYDFAKDAKYTLYSGTTVI